MSSRGERSSTWRSPPYMYVDPYQNNLPLRTLQKQGVSISLPIVVEAWIFKYSLWLYSAHSYQYTTYTCHPEAKGRRTLACMHTLKKSGTRIFRRGLRLSSGLYLSLQGLEVFFHAEVFPLFLLVLAYKKIAWIKVALGGKKGNLLNLIDIKKIIN